MGQGFTRISGLTVPDPTATGQELYPSSASEAELTDQDTVHAAPTRLAYLFAPYRRSFEVEVASIAWHRIGLYNDPDKI